LFGNLKTKHNKSINKSKENMIFQKLYRVRQNLHCHKSILKLMCILLIIQPYILCVYILSFKLQNEVQSSSASNTFDEIKNSINEFMNATPEQKLIDPNILIKTLKFMIKDVNPDDPELVEFVKTLIKMPSDKKLNLSTSFINHDYSQMKQSINVDKLLDNLENGFFIEAGAFDGEAFSNTLYFEIKRNWTGLLIEPIPSVFKDLLSKNRNVFSINACIGDKKPSLQLFNVLHVLSGRFDKMSVDHKKRILKEGLVNGKSVNSIALIPCFPIETILRALGQKKIDYFSLDVEGSELNIIKSLNYQEIDITAITLETSENIIDAAEITEHLSKNKFELMKRDYNEFYFLKINKKEF
jgi:hypothetical protein